MIDIVLVSSLLSTAAEPELSESDPALDQLIALAEHDQFIAAAEQAVQLWRERAPDVRLLGFILFGCFVEQGLSTLVSIADTIEESLTLNWPHLGPGKSKQRHCDVALRWLFTSIIGQLRFYQRTQDETWQKWLAQWAGAPQQQLLERIAKLATGLETWLPAPGYTCAQQVHSLRTFLQSLPSTTPPAAKALAAESTTASESRSAANSPLIEAEIRPAEYAPMEPEEVVDGTTHRPPQVLTVPLAPPMELLLRKLLAFNGAVKQGKFRQAAIIYTDLRKTLDHFDPRLYLPTLFGEFFSNIVTHADPLTKSLARPDDFTASALVELYQTDLDRFLATKG